MLTNDEDKNIAPKYWANNAPESKSPANTRLIGIIKVPKIHTTTNNKPAKNLDKITITPLTG